MGTWFGRKPRWQCSNWCQFADFPSSIFPPQWKLGGGNSNLFNFHPENWGKWSNLTHVFSDGLVQLPTRNPGLENGSFDPYCNGSANYLRFVGSSFDSICWKLGLLKLAMNFQWISASRKCCHNNFMKWLIYVDIMHLPKILLKSHFLELLHDYPRVTNTWNSVARNHSQPAIPILFSQKKERWIHVHLPTYTYIYI